MTLENYPLSDLDFLLSKDNITEDDLSQLPELLREDPKKPIANPLSFTSQKIYPSHHLKNLQWLWTIMPKSESQLPSQNSSFRHIEGTKKVRLEIASLKTNSSSLT